HIGVRLRRLPPSPDRDCRHTFLTSDCAIFPLLDVELPAPSSLQIRDDAEEGATCHVGDVDGGALDETPPPPRQIPKIFPPSRAKSPPPRQISKSLRPLPPSIHSPFRAPSSTSSAPSSSSPAVGTGAPSPFCASILVCRWSLKKLKHQLQIASDAAKRRRLLRPWLAAAPVQVLLQRSPHTFPSSEPPSAKPEPTDQTRKATGPLTYPNKGGVLVFHPRGEAEVKRENRRSGDGEQRPGASKARTGYGGLEIDHRINVMANAKLKPRYSYKRKEVRPGEFQVIMCHCLF
ncbi:hypothetical protein Taro_023128, partial [Colocasia esculenta]|nr:hypothetical protein [Colocasia esculenta]